MDPFKLRLGGWLFRFRSFTPLPLLAAIFLFFRPHDLGAGNAPLLATALALALAGEALRIHAVGFSGSGTSGRESFFRADDLNTAGLYSLVRHPLYWGNLLIYTGLLLAVGDPWVLAGGILFFVVQYYFIIASEEAYLHHRHGAEYREYCRRVPLYFPKLSGYLRPDRAFQVKKVLLKENDSLFNLLALFLAILAWREYRFSGRVSRWPLYLTLFFLLAISYTAAKIFKKTSFRSHPREPGS